MPVLSEEICLHPVELLGSPPIGAPPRWWWILHTKPRQEKALSRYLLGCDIPFYLPLVRKTLTYGHRRIHSYVPLFPGYVFFFGTEEDRVSSLATNRVLKILSVEDQNGLFQDLQRIRQLIASGAPLTVERWLSPGRRVRIRSGALAGLEGTVVRRQGGTHLIVSVDFIQQGASVAIDDAVLEAVDQRQPQLTSRR